MRSAMNPRAAKVVMHLSHLISEALYTCEHESHMPGADPDRMDAVIKEAANRASALQDFRAQFESMMSREGVFNGY